MQKVGGHRLGGREHPWVVAHFHLEKQVGVRVSLSTWGDKPGGYHVTYQEAGGKM